MSQKSVVAQPLEAITDDIVSFHPLGMLEAWKLPHREVWVQVRVFPPK